MKYVCLFVICILFVSCNSSNNRTYYLSEKERASNKILNEVAIQLRNEWGLIPSGTAGQMMDEIQMLGLSFKYLKPLDIEKGREILIDAVNRFDAAINADEKIRPYLVQFPFEPKNVLIEIYIHGPNYNDVEKGELSVISASDGILKYKIDDPITGRLTTICKETYEEAVQKIQSKR